LRQKPNSHLVWIIDHPASSATEHRDTLWRGAAEWIEAGSLWRCAA
jgi:hypothetical protein